MSASRSTGQNRSCKVDKISFTHFLAAASTASRTIRDGDRRSLVFVMRFFFFHDIDRALMDMTTLYAEPPRTRNGMNDFECIYLYDTLSFAYGICAQRSMPS
ncbi:hypothetical protein OPV22_023430 [Ensete ventricosum]|uniref:Uncharacterized protein n=1 Tax=Ensete ventricosum TaxID=4639 RepID=A0AAV8QQL8_ENSVE|nr:hypothetical protein OPV22_023430 [Ensete ventricosum]